jgi:hypothetical protein
MRIRFLASRPRLAFLGDSASEWSFPRTCDWAEARFFPTSGDNWDEVVEQAAAWKPDVCLVCRPDEIPAEHLARLPGMKIGLMLRPIFAKEKASSLTQLCAKGDAGYTWLTYLEQPPRELATLPILQQLPTPIDTSRFAAEPRLDQSAILVPEWAAPPEQLLADVRKRAPVTVASASTSDQHLLSLLSSHGLLLYWSTDLLGRMDGLPLAALANGMLLVANLEFPPEWGIELEDEYLVRAGDDIYLRAVDEVLRMPQSFHSVRVRAWQKIREAFAASASYHRLIHDAFLFTRGMELTAKVKPAANSVLKVVGS